MRDTKYYDQESTMYSQKRYDGEMTSYIRYFFTKRLELLLGVIEGVLDSNNGKKQSLLEIGCADGIICNRVNEKFPGHFREITGIDIAPKMIEVARANNRLPNAKYQVRQEFGGGSFDLILVIGVIHPQQLDSECAFIDNVLAPEGDAILTLPGKSSLHVKWKYPHGRSIYSSYAEYEEILKKYFEIAEARPFGFFVPKIWSIPFLGRIIQPLIEKMAADWAADLFHEKMYILRKKS